MFLSSAFNSETRSQWIKRSKLVSLLQYFQCFCLTYFLKTVVTFSISLMVSWSSTPDQNFKVMGFFLGIFTIPKCDTLIISQTRNIDYWLWKIIMFILLICEVNSISRFAVGQNFISDGAKFLKLDSVYLGSPKNALSIF